MTTPQTLYLPPDRLQAAVSGIPLPVTAEGSVLFADISGFTPVTERLRVLLGARRGAEQLAVYLNRVYDTLIAEVDRQGGSIIGFAGDAITCWFSGEASAFKAAACGSALLDAMRGVERIELSEGEALLLGLKVAITTGMTRRFLVGDPDIQSVDVLAGAVVARVAVGEGLAERGELLADAATVERLAGSVQVREWRDGEGERFAVLERFVMPVQSPLSTPLKTLTPADDALLSPMLPPFARDLPAGLDAFQIELRPVTALFLRFTGIDYDGDPDAREKLDRLMRLVQRIVTDYEGNVLQLTIGDKGSYLYAAFGAPYAHEDDPARALNAALDIQQQAAELGAVNPVQIGVSQGIMRTGAYGGVTRRTYGVLGDEVNLAARLMQQAEPETILISESMLGARLDQFALQSLSAIQVKGKTQPIRVFQVIGRRDRSFEERFYTTPLVGRNDVLEQVQGAVQPVFEARHAGVIYIYGEAGMGKSRLAFEVQQRVQAQASLTWMIGQANQLNRTPLSTFAYFLRLYFRQRRERDATVNRAAFDEVFDGLLVLADEAVRADLLLYRSFLAGIVGLIIPGSPYDTTDERLRIDNSIAAIKAWARAECRRQPLVIQLEDAQWLDASSIVAVQQLTYNMDGVSLALLLTSRYNDDGTPFIIPNIYSVPVHVFDLNRLSAESVQVVAGAVLKGEISDSLARFIGDRAEGNPFFTEQLALELKERGALVETDAMWDIRSDAAAEVPSGVNAVLIARLDRLAAQVKAVVQTAAVLGREFEVAVLSRMLRETETLAIREAEREAIWSALDELRYLFRHALLRDAAYEMQAQERLKMLHRLAAETIEALYPDDENQYDALLEHWHVVRDLERELRYLDPVANRLINDLDQYSLAERLLERALSQLDEGDSRRAMLFNWISAVQHLTGRLSEARQAALQALALAPANNPAVLAMSLQRLGIVAHFQDNYAEAQAYYEQSLAIRREIGDRSGTAHILRRLGGVSYLRGDYAEARAYVEQSLAIIQELDNRVETATTLGRLGGIARTQGAYKEAREKLEASLAIQRELGARRRMASDLSELGTIARLQGAYEEARDYHEQVLAIQQEMGNRWGVANSLISLGNVAFVQGAYQAARSYYERSLSVMRDVGELIGIAGNLNNLGAVAVIQGDYEAARAYHEESLAIRRKVGDRLGIAESLQNLGILVFRQKAYPDAEAYFRESLSIHRELKDGYMYSSIAWLGRVVLQLGDIEESRHLLQEGLVSLGTDDVAQRLTLLLLAAEIYRKQDRLKSAAELVSLIQSHSSTDAEVRDDAGTLLAELRPLLNSEAVDTALERGRSFDLDATIEQLLVALS